jgi:hypothetical protein
MAGAAIKVEFLQYLSHSYWNSGFMPYAALRQCPTREEQLTMANGYDTHASVAFAG